VVRVTPDDTATHQRYLAASEVHVDRIVRLKDTPPRVFAAPTLIVPDQNKTVLGAWVGKIFSDDGERVLHLGP
jgi:hypothetical protein